MQDQHFHLFEIAVSPQAIDWQLIIAFLLQGAKTLNKFEITLNNMKQWE